MSSVSIVDRFGMVVVSDARMLADVDCCPIFSASLAGSTKAFTEATICQVES